MNKTVLITGTSSGIGKTTAIHFANNGWNVVATMRTPEKETELHQYPNIFVTQLEVTEPSSIQQAVEKSIERFGKIDVVINNAGYGQQGLFEATSPEKIKAQFEVNVFGVMNVVRGILPHFRSNRSGTIVNISSGAGRVTTPMLSVYCASKFAVEGFTESLAFELDSQNIRVKIVEPGFIKTPFYERAHKEFAFDPGLEDYKEFSEEMNAFFTSFGSADNLFSSADVARIIYTAATDETTRLRYVAGPDIEPLLGIRNSKPDQEYVDFTRNLFMPYGFKK